MKNVAIAIAVVGALLGACGGSSPETTTTSTAAPTTIQSTTDVPETTTTTTTTTLPPAPDVAELLDGLIVAADVARTDQAIDSIGAAVEEFSCDEIASYTVATAADLAGHTPDATAAAQVSAAGPSSPWTIGFAEFASTEAAARVITSFAELAEACPTGLRQIPLEGPDGAQATDEAGNPIFIPANMTTVAVDFVIGDSAAGHAMSIEFAGASGDTAIHRGVAQWASIIFYFDGEASAADLERFGDLANQTVSASS